MAVPVFRVDRRRPAAELFKNHSTQKTQTPQKIRKR
jgi:hypothetical protein